MEKTIERKLETSLTPLVAKPAPRVELMMRLRLAAVDLLKRWLEAAPACSTPGMARIASLTWINTLAFGVG